MRALSYCLLGIAVAAGCASRSTRKVDLNAEQDVTERWGEADSRETSDVMVNDCLNQGWLQAFQAENERPPVVIVGTVVNRGAERIPTKTFVKDLQRALTNSSKVKFVANAAEREEVRAERDDMAANASDDTMKSAGNETGADFMLKGQIEMFVDEVGGEKLKVYQVNLELISLVNNETVWTGQHKIGKQTDQASVGL
jgi:penicillin-binding protein activator